MSKDLTPLEQAQRAYQDLRKTLDEAKEYGIASDTLFLQAPREEDTKQELLTNFAHLCELCQGAVFMEMIYKGQAEGNQAGEAAKKAAMELKKEADKRQAEIEELTNKALEHLNTAREFQNEYESLCGHCAEQNPADAVYCRRCGKVLEKKTEDIEETD